MAVLRLSLSTYVWPRRLFLDKIVHPLLYPTRGIVAGSGFAVFELKAALAIPMAFMRDAHPEIRLSTYVDDFATSVDQEVETDAVTKLYAGRFDLVCAAGMSVWILRPRRPTLVRIPFLPSVGFAGSSGSLRAPLSRLPGWEWTTPVETQPQ